MFAERLCSYLQSAPGQLELIIKCLELILHHDEPDSQCATMDDLFALICWFGPLNATRAFRGTLCERLLHVASQRWFFGQLSAKEATQQLAPFVSAPGTFLVRLNPGGTEPIAKAPFTISRVASSGCVTHVRIRTREGGYVVRYDNHGESMRIHCAV